ncbi:MAG: 6-carboxytetrahydropterin synthase [Bdellovibrionales bacterium]|nr:6-carboxytetrahydropterin synthase [Bdellovibrionales bacterium]
MLSISKSFEFSASHRLFRPEWDERRNSAVFGKCSNPNGHGHNYKLEVTVCGELNPETGMVLDASILDGIVTTEVIDHVDHANLDKDVAWLEGQVTTSEVIVEAVWKRLTAALKSQCQDTVALSRVRLWETSKIYAEKVSGLERSLR